MKLDFIKWKNYKIAELFQIEFGNGFDYNKMTKCDDVLVDFVTRTNSSNGVSAKVDGIEGIEPFKEGCITIALGGSVGSAFVQNNKFYTCQGMAVLTPYKNDMTLLQKLFICKLINFETSVKFVAYGRELFCNLKNFTIKLPTINDEPDFNFIEKYMREILGEIMDDNYKIIDKILG